MYTEAGYAAHLASDPREVRAISRLKLRDPILVCIPINPEGKPEAARDFLTALRQSIQEGIAQQPDLRLAGAGEVADAEIHIEVWALHNGKGHAGPMLEAFLASVLLIQLPHDPAVAGCAVMLVRPETNQVLAGYQKSVSTDPVAGDRFEALAKSLGRAVANGAAEVKRLARDPGTPACK